MRGSKRCDFGTFGRRCEEPVSDLNPFGHYGPCDRLDCGPPRLHFGPPETHSGPPDPSHGHKHHGLAFWNRGPAFGWGPDSGNCCHCWVSEKRRFGRGPCPRVEERGPHGPPDCSDCEHPRFGPHGPEGRGHGPHGPPCGRPRDRSRDKSPHGRRRSPSHGGNRAHDWVGPWHGSRHHVGNGPHGRVNPCHGPPHHGKKHHSRRGQCHRSPSQHHSRPCGLRDHGDEIGPHDHHRRGPFGHFGPHFGGYHGPHRRPFSPYDRCQRNNSDEESGNETERFGRAKRPCCRKNKDKNRDETILVQRIVVEKARCNSV